MKSSRRSIKSKRNRPTVSAAQIMDAADLIDHMHEIVRLVRAISILVEADRRLSDAGLGNAEFKVVRKLTRAGYFGAAVIANGRSSQAVRVAREASHALGESIEELATALSVLGNQQEIKLLVGYTGWVQNRSMQAHAVLSGQGVTNIFDYPARQELPPAAEMAALTRVARTYCA